MHRRDFLRRASLLAAGVVAADQLDLVERLGWRRRFFSGWSPSDGYITYRNLRLTGIDYHVDPSGRTTITLHFPKVRLSEPIIGAKYSPDVWAL